MRRKCNRFLAGLLAAIIMITSAPIPAYAMENGKTITSVVDTETNEKEKEENDETEKEKADEEQPGNGEPKAGEEEAGKVEDGDTDTENSENGDTENKDSETDIPEKDDTETEDAESEESEDLLESGNEDSLDRTIMENGSEDAESASEDAEYTITFNVKGIDTFTAYIRYNVEIDKDAQDCVSKEIKVSGGKATLPIKVESVKNQEKVFLAIGGIAYNQLNGKPYDGNITCNKGATYYQLRESDGSSCDYLFNLGEITENATFDFRHGFDESECQKVVIKTKESDRESFRRMSIIYSSNGFNDSVDSESERAIRGEMIVDNNNDAGEFVFWIPKGYDWVIENVPDAGVNYENSCILDKDGKNCLTLEQETIYYKPLKESDIRKEGELKIYHNFGTMPETIEGDALEYTICHREQVTITFKGSPLKGVDLDFYMSIDGEEWKDFEWSTGYAGENGQIALQPQWSGYKLAITGIDSKAIFTFPLLFSEDGVKFYETEMRTIEVPSKSYAMQAYILEVPESDKTIYVKSAKKTFHVDQYNPVGYSTEYLSGVTNVKEGIEQGVYDGAYDGESDLTFKITNPYGNAAPDVDIRYYESNEGWVYEDDGNLSWTTHCAEKEYLNTAFTITPDENGIYTITKEQMAQLSDICVRNAVLYFWPRIDCYKYYLRVGDVRIKSADIIVGKERFELDNPVHCATVHIPDPEDEMLEYRIPIGYYIGPGKIESDVPDLDPAFDIDGAYTEDGWLIDKTKECVALYPYSEDRKIWVYSVGADVYPVFAFQGYHTTLKDVESQLPEDCKWKDDSIKIAPLGNTPTKFAVVSKDTSEELGYQWVSPLLFLSKVTNVITAKPMESKIEKGNTIFVAPAYELSGDVYSLGYAEPNITFEVKAVTDNISFTMDVPEDNIYRLTGLKAGKGIIRTYWKCELKGQVLAEYTNDYVIEVVDSDQKGIADIKVELVTKNAEGQDVPVPVNEEDGVYHVVASDKLYLKNETVPYDGTGKINTVKFTSSDTAIAKVGKVTGAYTELIPVTSGYAVITAKAADTLGTTKDIVVKVGPAKNDKDEVVYDNTNILLNEYAVTLNTLSSDIAGTVEVITPSGEKVTAVEAVNAKGNADANYTVSVSDNKVTIKGTPQSKTGKIYLKVTLDDEKKSVVTIKNPVTVTVKKTVPKLNMKQTAKLDTYYKDGKAELIISVPGEKITKVSVNEDSKYDVTVKPEELGKSSVNGVISLKNNTQAAELKNTSVTVSVSLEGFAAPLEKVIKVGTMQSATALSAISGTVYKGKNNTLITRVMNKNTKSVVSLADAEEVSCNSENYEITTDTVKNELRITPKTELAKGKSEKITITVKAKEMQFAKTYTYTVKYADASSMALEIKNKSLGLYKYDGDKKDTARTVITLKGGAGSDILNNNVKVKDSSNAKTATDYAKLRIVTSYEAGVLLVNATVSDNSIKAGSYKYTFYIPKETAGTRKDISTVLTVKVTDATGKKAPAVKATIKGKLDTVNRTVGVDIIPKFTNVKTDDATVTAVLTGRDAHLFEIGADGKLYLVKSANVLTKYKYQINIQYTVQREDLTFVCTTPAINITLSQSKPKVYATKLTAFSATMQDTNEVKLSIQNAKGEQLNIEKIQVVNTNSAFTVVTDAATGIVSITHNPKAGKTKKGKSYKITLQIYPKGCANNEKPVTVTCPIKISK